MKYSGFLAIFLSVLLISCNSSEKETETAPLQFQPEPGLKKELVYEFSLESPSQKATLHYAINATFEVESSKDSLTEVKLTYNEVSLTGNIDTLTIDVNAAVTDTNQIEGSLYAEPYFVCLNHEFLVTFDQKMNKQSELLITRKDPEKLTEPTNKIQFFTSLPATPIEEGTKWKAVVELKSGKNHSVTSEFVIKKIENGVAIGEFSGDLDGSGSQFDLDYSLKGKVYGSFEIDIKTGLPLKSEMTQDLILIMTEKETPMKFHIIQYFK